MSMSKQEQLAVGAVIKFCDDNRELLSHIASWGDGECGYIAALMCRELGILDAPHVRTSNQKRSVPLAMRIAVLDAHGDKCLRCGADEDICIDHVIPVSRGGKQAVSNMQPLCRSCNSIKGVTTKDYRKVPIDAV